MASLCSFSDKDVPTFLSFTLSSTFTTGTINQDSRSTPVTSSLLAEKRQFASHKGKSAPSALPHNLLPLLARGLSLGSLSGAHSLDHQAGGSNAPTSVSASSQGSEALPKDSPSPPLYTETYSTEPGPTPTTSTEAAAENLQTGREPSLCTVNLTGPEGYIDSSDDPPLLDGSFFYCTYTITVYTGYGVELQVKSVNLSDSEQLSIRGADEAGALLVLANHTLLVEGQVIRSPTNTMSVYYRSGPEGSIGTFQLHYQIFRLSCSLPRRPHFGEVTVLDLLPGGIARFHCHMGYHMHGDGLLTCLNASLPAWSGKEPTCRALCGGTVKNATVGRVLSPSSHHGLHLHLERLALGPTDRLVLWSGLDAGSVVLFDSGRGGQIPFEGVISEGPAVRIQFITDQPNHNTGFNIRYEAFERGHCYEPYLQNGNFTTSDPVYGVGTVVQFSCDPGHSLEQGPPVIECISARDPYWNDTEPLCKAQCGGDLAGPGGVILSPNWPEWYGEGEDCSWRIHVSEDKRVLLDVQLLNISDSDMLTITDGDEVTTHVLARYMGGSSPFKLSSTTPDLTITFHSDPAGLVFGKGEGFIINYMEVSRNDSCPDLPEIQNGWKTTSHIALVRGARITYQCDPGYDLVGRETLTCQLDLSWSSQPPFCEKIMYCSDAGHVEHSTRMLSDPKLLVGTTIQYTCNPGFILQGGATITCYGREPGTPVWTSRLPHCVCECQFAEATAHSTLEGGNVALAVFILVLVLSVLLGGAYVYVTRCRYHSNLRLPLIYPHPYRQITVETEFDNPLYETGGVNVHIHLFAGGVGVLPPRNFEF
uniref:Seizure related 6 homolog (mouse)-like n=1 Tax=Neogobius melanostomus TaxID=47308 RepID=A0A8C6U8W9_9GOBI